MEMGDDGLPHGCCYVVTGMPVVICTHKLHFLSFRACNAAACSPCRPRCFGQARGYQACTGLHNQCKHVPTTTILFFLVEAAHHCLQSLRLRNADTCEQEIVNGSAWDEVRHEVPVEERWKTCRLSSMLPLRSLTERVDDCYVVYYDTRMMAIDCSSTQTSISPFMFSKVSLSGVW